MTTCTSWTVCGVGDDKDNEQAAHHWARSARVLVRCETMDVSFLSRRTTTSQTEVPPTRAS